MKQLDEAKQVIMNQAATITELNQQVTKLSGDYKSICKLHSLRFDIIDQRQRLLRDRTKQLIEQLAIQTSVNNHALRAIEKTEKDVNVVTLQLKGWHGWTTTFEKKKLVKRWRSQMDPPIPDTDYRFSTEDHKGKDSKVMHIRFDWPRHHMRFLKTVQT